VIFRLADKSRSSADKPRLSPALAAVIARLKAGGYPEPGENQFIREGKAQIRLTVTNDNEPVRAKLRALGFEVISWPQAATTVIGRLAIDKLEALLDLDSVVYMEEVRRETAANFTHEMQPLGETEPIPGKAGRFR